MDRDALVRSLALTPDLLEGFIANCPDELIDRRRGGGLWSVREHAVHLAAVQPMLCGRIEAFRDDPRPTMKPYNPAEEDAAARSSADLAETLAAFREWRERQVEILDGLDDAVWSREGVHPGYDRYGLELLAAHIHFHDGFHLYRMEEMAYVKDGGLTTLP